MSDKLLKVLATRLRDPEHKFLDKYAELHTEHDILFFAVRENEDVEDKCNHYHSYFEALVKPDVKHPETKYKVYFKQKGFKGNEQFSVKVMDKYGTFEENKMMTLRYLCKGKDKDTLPDVIFNTIGLTIEEIQKYHDDYWKLNAELQSKKKDKGKSFMHVVRDAFFDDPLYEKLKDIWRKGNQTHYEVHQLGFMLDEWLCQTFHTFEKLQDLPLSRKYATYLIQFVVPYDKFSRARTSASDRYF